MDKVIPIEFCYDGLTMERGTLEHIIVKRQGDKILDIMYVHVNTAKTKAEALQFAELT